MNVAFQSIEESQQMVELLNSLPETGEGMRWAIVENSSGIVMGSCGYHNVKAEHSRAEVGYELGHKFWGMGVMQEVMPVVLNYCFHTKGFNRIEAFVTVGNQRSISTLERLGFKPEGILRDYEFAQGQFQSQVILSILKKDWDS